MTDQSGYTLEFRILSAVWYHESEKDIAGMRQLKKRLRDRFDGEPPDIRVIRTWEEKLFESGTIMDKKRPGRPNERGDEIDNVTQSVHDNPTMSLRRRSNELDMSYSSLQRVMTKDIGLKPWKPTKCQFLSLEDHQKHVECCEAILHKYDNLVRKEKLFLPTNVRFMQKEKVAQ